MTPGFKVETNWNHRNVFEQSITSASHRYLNEWKKKPMMFLVLLPNFTVLLICSWQLVFAKHVSPTWSTGGAPPKHAVFFVLWRKVYNSTATSLHAILTASEVCLKKITTKAISDRNQLQTVFVKKKNLHANVKSPTWDLHPDDKSETGGSPVNSDN